MKPLKTKKRFLIIFVSVSSLFLFVFGFFSYYNFKIETAKKNLAKIKFSSLNTGCIIKTLGQNTEEINANISFYTPQNKLIGSYERSWQGWELNIECIVLPLGKDAIVFPHRLFSNKTKFGTGVMLFHYYSKQDYPAIYDYDFFSAEEKNAIKALFKFAKFTPHLFEIFSKSNTQTVNLREFKLDKEYSLYINAENKIYLNQNY